MKVDGKHFRSIWLEPDGSGAKLYFGEFNENLREASPGLLEELVCRAFCH